MRSPASPAGGPQQEPAQHWYVVPVGDRLVALAAVRPWKQTTDSPAGSRRMQTLRKLPSSKPNNPKKIQKIIAEYRLKGFIYSSFTSPRG
jgi:hypothetical protein